jgi:hypothetical protein
VSLLPALLALRGGDLAAYHGVEHKAIAAYEQGEDARDADKEHDRAARTSSRRCWPRPCSERGGAPGRVQRPAADAVVTFGSLGSRSNSRLVRAHAGSGSRAALRRPGREIQRASAPEPTEAQLESAEPRSPRSSASRRGGVTAPAVHSARPSVFRLPVERIRSGYTHDQYFQPDEELLEREAGIRP